MCPKLVCEADAIMFGYANNTWVHHGFLIDQPSDPWAVGWNRRAARNAGDSRPGVSNRPSCRWPYPDRNARLARSLLTHRQIHQQAGNILRATHQRGVAYRPAPPYHRAYMHHLSSGRGTRACMEQKRPAGRANAHRLATGQRARQAPGSDLLAQLWRAPPLRGMRVRPMITQLALALR